MYADDILLLASSPADLQYLTDATAEYCDGLGHTVNPAKSEVLVLGERDPVTAWSCGGGEVRQVQDFKYLGIIFNRSYRTDRMISNRLAKGESVVAAALVRLRQLDITHVPTCAKLFKQLVYPLISYGAEVWGTAFLSPDQPMQNPLQ